MFLWQVEEAIGVNVGQTERVLQKKLDGLTARLDRLERNLERRLEALDTASTRGVGAHTEHLSRLTTKLDRLDGLMVRLAQLEGGVGVGGGGGVDGGGRERRRRSSTCYNASAYTSGHNEMGLRPRTQCTDPDDRAFSSRDGYHVAYEEEEDEGGGGDEARGGSTLSPTPSPVPERREASEEKRQGGGEEEGFFDENSWY